MRDARLRAASASRRAKVTTRPERTPSLLAARATQLGVIPARTNRLIAHQRWQEERLIRRGFFSMWASSLVLTAAAARKHLESNPQNR